MSMKKFFAILLCATIAYTSMSSVSANSVTTMEPLSAQSNNIANQTPINQSEYIGMLPNQLDENYISVTGYMYSFKASRTQTGEVEVIIHTEQKSGHLLCYFEHLATDAEGYNFTAEKNSLFSIDKNGDYRIVLADDSVSSDGYVYMKTYIPYDLSNPSKSSKLYKIPVDYDQFKTNNREQRELFSGDFLVIISSMYEKLTTRSYKLPNGDVQVDLQINEGTTYGLMMQMQAVSNDGSIFIPSRNKDYFINTTDGTITSFIIPADQVPTTNKLYFNIFIDLRYEMKLSNVVYIQV